MQTLVAGILAIGGTSSSELWFFWFFWFLHCVSLNFFGFFWFYQAFLWFLIMAVGCARLAGKSGEHLFFWFFWFFWFFGFFRFLCFFVFFGLPPCSKLLKKPSFVGGTSKTYWEKAKHPANGAPESLLADGETQWERMAR